MGGKTARKGKRRDDRGKKKGREERRLPNLPLHHCLN